MLRNGGVWAPHWQGMSIGLGGVTSKNGCVRWDSQQAPHSKIMTRTLHQAPLVGYHRPDVSPCCSTVVGSHAVQRSLHLILALSYCALFHRLVWGLTSKRHGNMLQYYREARLIATYPRQCGLWACGKEVARGKRDFPGRTASDAISRAGVRIDAKAFSISPQ